MDRKPTYEELEQRIRELEREVLEKKRADKVLLESEEIRNIIACKFAEKKIEHLKLVLNAIRNINRLITREKNRERLLQSACDNLIENRGYYNAWIALLDESGALLMAVQAGLGEDFLPMVEQMKRGRLTRCSQKALEKSGVIVTEDPLCECTDCPISRNYAGRGAMTVRLEHGGKVCGILSVSIPKDLSTDKEEQVLFEEVAEDIAFALYNVKMEEERKKVEKLLQESEERFRKISFSAQDAIIIMDNDGNISFWNQAAEKVFGYTSEEALGKELHPFLAPVRYQKAYIKGLDGFKNTGEGPFVGKTIELSAVRKDGEEIPIEISFSAMELKGKWNAIGIVRDISERKRSENELKAAKDAAEAATRAKSEFLANMSHEIRTPMNGVIAATDLALGEEMSPKVEHYLKIIHSSAHSLLGIIDNILDFSNIEDGKLDLETRAFRLDDVLDSVTGMFSNKAAEKRIELLVDIDHQTPKALVGDPLRLQQILKNLVDNAVKFTEKGGVILVGTKGPKKTLNQVTLTFFVKDTGVGIAPEYLPKLFESFSQADASTTRKYEGAGLGLSICKKLVEMMDGKIWVESELGKGTTFTFTARFGLRPAEQERKLVLPLDVKGLKVLVVDDCAESRVIMQKMLESFGFRMESVSSGIESLNMLKESEARKEPFDLVMIDWLMPELDGIETSRRIRHDLKLTLPIIMMTAFGKEAEKIDAERAGVNVFLTKPISQSPLFNAIMDALGKEALERARKEKPITTMASIYKKRLRGIRILVAEDNPTNQAIVLAVLEKAGIVVEIADNGKKAVDAVRRNHFDAVLMDIQMPEMDGYEATRTIRQDPKFKSLPIIAMTAHAMKGDEEKCIHAGMDGHVSKPIDQDKLFHTLWRLLKIQKRPPRGKEIEAVGPEPRRLDRREIETGELPARLPGINIQDAVSALNIDHDTFKRILIGFLRNNKDTMNKIRTALDRKELESLRQLAHSLKGSAGNIGANTLQKSAQELETASGEEAVKLPASLLIDNVETALNQVLESIQLLADTPKIESLYNKEIRVDLKKLNPVLKQLVDALELADPEEIKKHMDMVKEYLDSAILQNLENQVDDYDYDEALKTLRGIAEKIGAQLG